MPYRSGIFQRRPASIRNRNRMYQFSAYLRWQDVYEDRAAQSRIADVREGSQHRQGHASAYALSGLGAAAGSWPTEFSVPRPERIVVFL